MLALVLLLLPDAAAATWTVCTSGSCQFTSIEQAINTAFDGDTILVSAGTYSESSIDVSDDLTIIGAGSDVTLIQSTSSVDLLVFRNSTGSMSGFRVDSTPDDDAISVENDGEWSFDDIVIAPNNGAQQGLGFSVIDGSVVTIANSVIDGQSSQNGAALYARGAGTLLTLIDCEVTNNTSDTQGVIFVESGADLHVSGGLFADNQVTDPLQGSGGVIFVNGSNGGSIVEIDGAVFERNSSMVNGGAIRLLNNVDATIRNATFEDHAADTGGTIHANQGATLVVEDSAFTLGDALIEGGHLYSEGPVAIVGSTFDLGTAPLGGHVSIATTSGMLGVGDSTFTGGVATDDGGAIASDQAQVTITGSQLVGNSATDRGGAVAHQSTRPLTIDNSTFDANSAANGGALYSDQSNTVTIDGSVFSSNDADSEGGALSLRPQSMTARGNRFLANTAGTLGGAVHIGVSNGVPVFRRNGWCQNTAGTSGGALAATDAVNVSNDLFAENTATTGGHLYVGSTGSTVAQATFVGGTATTASRGAVFFDVSGGLSSAIVTGTTSGSGVATDTSATVDYSDLFDNVATDVAGSVTVSNSLAVDPLFFGYTPGDGCDGDFRIPYAGPLRDGGSPTRTDLDGSRADIGLWGGPDAPPAAWSVDLDGDGWPWVYDCDETDPLRNPGVEDVCFDGLDQDCSMVADDPIAAVLYADADGDGYGDAGDAWADVGCPPTGVWVDNGLDCDDTDAAISPDGVEMCDPEDDDEDCDGTADDGDPDASGRGTWYVDADLDGYGDVEILACDPAANEVALGGDCADDDAAVNPAATEVCDGADLDEDCSGLADDADAGVDPTTRADAYTDADGDGFGDDATHVEVCDRAVDQVGQGGDCDDDAATSFPGGTEVCNGADDDCDGQLDDGVLSTFWLDLDGDAYGDASATTTACTAPSGYVADDTDCDDTRAAVNPGAQEVCDAADLDEDCDGAADDNDDAAGETSWWRDIDDDGYGDPTSVTVTRCNQPTGRIDNNGDCDDDDAAFHPGAAEGCGDPDFNCDGSTGNADADADGAIACLDCDDGDADAFPGNGESCDGADNDCDGTIDEAGATGERSWYGDGDGDGFGASSDTVVACTAPAGHVAASADCDDTNPTISPAGSEVCDGLDQDCDGTADDGVSLAFYPDDDDDGYGTAVGAVQACSAPAGTVAVAGDCDDGDAAINPGEAEVCDADDADEDCDGEADDADTDVGGQGTWYEDRDDDGFGDHLDAGRLRCDAPSGTVAASGDCDDLDPDISPAAVEVCDAADLDEDCDGDADDADAGVTGTSPFYPDADADGFGDEGAAAVDACTAPSGTVPSATDCDDGDPAIHPGAPEDCSQAVDANCDGSAGSIDADVDGVLACDDCDDGDDTVFPGATETCDGDDEDCDGLTDEAGAAGEGTFFVDADGDGYGDPAATVTACQAPSGSVANDQDCDDGDPGRNPGEIEVCDGLDTDEDCDGEADDADDDPAGRTRWYADTDGDGYGDPDAEVRACEPPAGTVLDATDCDDTDAAVHPDTTWYADGDEDGHGDPAAATLACGAPSGFVAVGDDCDDLDPTAFTGAAEACDGADDDCDGVADDGIALPTWYVDADGDGFGDNATGIPTCTPDVAWVLDGGDCDDENGSISPVAPEICDGDDQNCDGVADDGLLLDWYFDGDDDGYGDSDTVIFACQPPGVDWVFYGGDCDDDAADASPEGVETCDGSDENCDGTIDDGFDVVEYWLDADEDGWGDEAFALEACELPAGYSDQPGDCADDEPEVHPDALEQCNEADDDCDDLVDEELEERTWYVDADGDGYGDPATAETGCDWEEVFDGTDCDDGDAAVHPGAPEVFYDGVDADCAGDSDFDQDLDGFAGGEGGPDCDDLDAAVHPDAEDPDDAVDQDCDGWTDADGDLKLDYCGCATNRPAPGWLAFAAVAASALLRARSRRLR